MLIFLGLLLLLLQLFFIPAVNNISESLSLFFHDSVSVKLIIWTVGACFPVGHLSSEQFTAVSLLSFTDQRNQSANGSHDICVFADSSLGSF